jgi:hypothetical protein
MTISARCLIAGLAMDNATPKGSRREDIGVDSGSISVKGYDRRCPGTLGDSRGNGSKHCI